VTDRPPGPPPAVVPLFKMPDKAKLAILAGQTPPNAASTGKPDALATFIKQAQADGATAEKIAAGILRLLGY